MPYPYRSFRDWVREEESLGNVLRVKEPIKCGDYSNLVDIGFSKYHHVKDAQGYLKGKIPETEVRALARYLHTLPNCPIGIIENPVDNRPDIPVVVNVWPNRERTLRSMGLSSKAELIEKLAAAIQHKVKPTVVSKTAAPCKEVIIGEQEIDLMRNIPRIWVEFNKLCFTACNGTIVAYDPETGTHGLTKTRLSVFDWDNGDPAQAFPAEKIKRYGFATMARPGRATQGNTGRYYFEKYRAKGKNWPAAFVYGIPTDMHVQAATKTIRWPEVGDEYEILGGLRGEPVELVESETIPGLMVPAQAEWVIEGEFVSEDYVTPETSEDGAHGFIWGKAIWPLFKVNCITHRKNPLWDATTFSSLGSKDHLGVHTGLTLTANEAMLTRILQMQGFKVKDVVMQAMLTVVIQLEVDGLDKPRPGYGEEVGRAIGATYTFVVGPDIDPYNMEEVMWAANIRAGKIKWQERPKPPSDGLTEPEYGLLNPVLDKGGFMVIDATIPVPERFDYFPPRTEPPEWERQAVRAMAKRLKK